MKPFREGKKGQCVELQRVWQQGQVRRKERKGTALIRGQTAGRRTETTVNRHKVTALKLIHTGLELKVPLPPYVRKGKGITTRAVRHRRAVQMDSSGIYVSFQRNAIHRKRFLYRTKTPRDVQRILHRMPLPRMARAVPRQFLPVVTPPTLDQHQQVRRTAVH